MMKLTRGVGRECISDRQQIRVNMSFSRLVIHVHVGFSLISYRYMIFDGLRSSWEYFTNIFLASKLHSSWWCHCIPVGQTTSGDADRLIAFLDIFHPKQFYISHGVSNVNAFLAVSKICESMSFSILVVPLHSSKSANIRIAPLYFHCLLLRKLQNK